MSKNRHRKKQHQTSKELEKVSRAHHRNLFFEKLRKICKLVAGDDVYKMLPQKFLEHVYDVRFLPSKTIPASGHNIPKSVMQEISMLVNPLANMRDTPITSSGVKIPLDEYFSVSLTFMIMIKKLEDSEFKEAAEVKRRMIEYTDYEKGLEIAELDMAHILQSLAVSFNDLADSIYWFKIDTELAKGRFNYLNALFLHRYYPEKRSVIINGISRPVSRVCFAIGNEGVRNISVKASALGLEGYEGSSELEVFIQSHALIRMDERLDCVIKGFMHFTLVLSLDKPVVHIDRHGNMFIEFRIFETKAGYLLVKVIDNMLIIQTFLFLTNNGTPEGEKLKEIYGLGILDKKYLAIDKLSAFMAEDLSKNEQLVKILNDIECSNVFDLYEKCCGMIIKDSKSPSPELLKKYLGMI